MKYVVNENKKESIRSLLDRKDLSLAEKHRYKVLIIKMLDRNIYEMIADIENVTNNDSFWFDKKHTIGYTLLSYCSSRNFNNQYDGLFWGNEGYYWKFTNNIDVVEKIDNFFKYVRETYYPELEMKPIDIEDIYTIDICKRDKEYRDFDIEEIELNPDFKWGTKYDFLKYIRKDNTENKESNIKE